VPFQLIKADSGLGFKIWIDRERDPALRPGFLFIRSSPFRKPLLRSVAQLYSSILRSFLHQDRDLRFDALQKTLRRQSGSPVARCFMILFEFHTLVL